MVDLIKTFVVMTVVWWVVFWVTGKFRRGG